MSEFTEQEEMEANGTVSANVGTSLQGRMRAALEEQQRKTTEFFPIPRFEALLAVELKRLSFETIRKTQRRNEKVRDPTMQELYGIADNLVRATVGIYEILGEDDYKETPFGWQDVARLLPNCPDELTDRIAILHVIGTERIHFLAGQWGQWAASGTSEDLEEVKRDFEPTG